MLLLYPATLLNTFVSSNSFPVDYLGFSLYKVMPSVNRGSFTSFQFGCLIFLPPHAPPPQVAMAGTFNTVLNRSSESRHPCVFPDFREKAFRLSPLSMFIDFS